MALENIRKFAQRPIGYYVIMEGIFFYAGFAMMLSFKRNNKMIGVGEQFQYILRDESVHLAFGTDLINTIVAENPETWTDDFKKATIEKIKKAVELEAQYAKDCLPKRNNGAERRHNDAVHALHSRQEAGAAEPAADIQREEPIPMAERDNRPEEGEELLRDQGHRIQDRRPAGMVKPRPNTGQ